MSISFALDLIANAEQRKRLVEYRQSHPILGFKFLKIDRRHMAPPSTKGSTGGGYPGNRPGPPILNGHNTQHSGHRGHNTTSQAN